MMDERTTESMDRAKQLFSLLIAIDRTLRDGFKRDAGMPFGLSKAQYEIITLIAAAGPQSQTSLAEGLGITGPTVVRIVDALEKKGLVMRTRGESDRRLVFVSLTELGRKAQVASTDIHEERVAAASRHLPDETIEALLTTISAYLASARTTQSADAA